MKTLNFIIIPIFYFSVFTNVAIAASKKDVTTCTSPGADPTGVNDSATAIQSCLNSSGSEAAIYFPPGQYKIGSTLTVSQNNVTLYSDARATAKLTFFGCGDMIKFSKNTSMIFNGGIHGLWLQGSNGGSCVQTGLHVNDVSWMSVVDSKIDGFSSTTDQSTGINTNGREGFNVRNTNIAANNPVTIGRNPNHAYLDADHFHFENIYTQVIGGGQHWHITLQDQVTVTNTTIDGQNAMTRGCGILKWISTTAPVSVSYDLKIANVRHEQMTSGCDKDIDIELPIVLQGLVIDNVHLQGPFITSATAVFLRNVDGLTMRNTTFENQPLSPAQSATLIDATGIKYIDLQNNHVYAYAQKISAKDPNNVDLIWKSGPHTGKECCYQNGGTGPWLKSSDSGILGQP